MRVRGREIPSDAIAFVAIAVAIVATHVPLLRVAPPLDNTSSLFHFGNKTLHQAVPYRDYIFPNGPLPIWIDTLFQAIGGERYRASLFASLFVLVLRVFATWAFASRLAGWRAAAALCVACGLDPMFATDHASSAACSELLMVACALFVALAVGADRRRERVYIGCAGAVVAAIAATQPCLAVVLIASLILVGVTLYRQGECTRPQLGALWAGCCAVFVVLSAVLATMGALGDAIHQTLIDMPAKQGMHLGSVLDALTGGATTDANWSIPSACAVYLGLPCVIVALLVVMASRTEREISSVTIANVVVPSLIVFGLYRRYMVFDVWHDVPRLFFMVTTAVALGWPERVRRWFGVEPVLALAVGGIPLAAELVAQLGHPGRGSGDSTALVTGAILFVLASSRVSERAKTGVCAVLAIVAIAHTSVRLKQRVMPFDPPDVADDTFQHRRVTMHGANPAHDLLGSLRMPPWREHALEWLGEQIPRGSTCFVDGDLPLLYNMLDCSNPSRVDDADLDYANSAETDAAIAALRERPPDFILVQVRAGANGALHAGIQSLLGEYTSVGTVGQALEPGDAQQAAAHSDALDAIAVYRRTR